MASKTRVHTLAIAVVTLILAGCGAGSHGSRLPNPNAPLTTSSLDGPTFDVYGELFVGPGNYIDPNGNPNPSVAICAGLGNYPDLHVGAQVTIMGADGQTVVGLGKLDSAEPRGTSLCDFKFTVNDVEGGQKYYSVKIGSQAPREVAEDDLRLQAQAYHVG